MIRLLALLSWLLALAACAIPPMGGGPFCRVRPAAVLPAQLDRGALLVPARINDTPVLMEVDTGAMTTLIARDAIGPLRLPPDPLRGARLLGTGGSILTRNALVQAFEFGGVVSQPRSIPTGPLTRTMPAVSWWRGSSARPIWPRSMSSWMC